MSDWPINQPDDPTRLDVPTDILCSFHYFGDIDMGAMRSWGTRIIGDSGAFSAMSLGKPIEREVFHADRSFRVEQLLQQAGALSLFASRRLLELRLAGKPGKELGEALTDAVARLPDDVLARMRGDEL